MSRKHFVFAFVLCSVLLLVQGCASVQSGKSGCKGRVPVWQDWDNWKNNPPELRTRPEKISQENWDLRLIKQREAFEKFAPWILDEFKQIDSAMGWPQGFAEKKACYGVKNNIPPPEHECTSWAAMPDVTGNKSVIIHKNRDSSIGRLAVYRHQVPGKNAFIGCGGYGSLFPMMGFNDKGVAAIMNAGDTTDDVHSFGLDTGQQLRIVLECCDNAGDAIKMLKKMTLAGAYRRPDCGSIWYVADAETAFVGEATLSRFEYAQIKSGFSIRANEWRLPSMRPLSKDGPGHMMYSCKREAAVQKLLMVDAFRKNGFITEGDIGIASRFRTDTEDAKKRFTKKELESMLRLCGDRTISGGTFVLDREYPRELSTAWIACGHIWHALYIPYPVTLTDFPKHLTNGEYADKVFQRFAKHKYKTPLDGIFKVEEEMRQAHNAAVAEARKLLRQKRRDEAVKLLNDTFAENWKRAMAYHENAK